MSDNYLRLIPVDARFVPSEDAARAAVNVLGPALPDADSVVAESHDYPVFIDQGTNLECIVCPACGARLAFDPPEEAEAVREWWYAITEPLEAQNVADLRIAMHCCRASVLFADLAYEWPAGVASFEISVLNPGVQGSLPEGLVGTLESILGCKVRQIWAHY